MTATKLLGSTVPRIYTPPLPGRDIGEGLNRGCPCGCALGPETTRGFEVITWAEVVLRVILNPWQKWLLIHALELAYDGSMRFRTILVLVARQNGKTLVKAVLSLWRLFEGGARYLVGTAQDLSQAREVMNEVLVPMMLEVPELRERFDPDTEDLESRVGIWHKTLNDEYFRLDSRWRGGRAIGPHGPRYLIKALNRRAGRGLAGVTEVNIDELREQTDHKGWAAISKVVMAIADAQIWCMSNMGDSTSVVLNQLRGVAMGGQDETMFHAEWSAPEGCPLDDPEMWAMANPSLGYTPPPAPGMVLTALTEGSIRSAMYTDPPGVFRTEVLCQGVDILNTAIDPAGWAACGDAGGSAEPGPMALCVEAALESEQVIAMAATRLPDGRVRLDLAGVWDGTERARTGIGDLRGALKPAAIGWYPKGPGAALGSKLRSFNPEGTKTKIAHEIKGERVAEAHMTMADFVQGRRLIHPDNPLLNEMARHTGTVGTAASWVFDRGPGATHGMWAAAGALWLALHQPERKTRSRRVIVATAPEPDRV